MAKPNYQYEKRQKDLAKQRKKQEKEQEKAARKAAGKVGRAGRRPTRTEAADAPRAERRRSAGLSTSGPGRPARRSPAAARRTDVPRRADRASSHVFHVEATPAARSTAIFWALGANAGIAIAKFAAAFYTGSGSMLAEAIHSLADCGNQVLLLVGLRQAKAASRRSIRSAPAASCTSTR